MTNLTFEGLSSYTTTGDTTKAFTEGRCLF